MGGAATSALHANGRRADGRSSDHSPAREREKRRRDARTGDEEARATWTGEAEARATWTGVLGLVVRWFVRSGRNHSRDSEISIYSRCTWPKTTTTTTASKRKREQWNAQTVTGSRSSRSGGSAGVVVVRRRHGFGDASHRWQRPFSRSGLGLGCAVGNWLRGESRTASPGPTFLL
jgi:hypothetical protein